MIKFNNKPLPSFLKITSFTFSVLPEITLKQVVVPNKIGVIDNGINFGAIAYQFDFILLKKVKEDDVLDYIDEFKKWARGDKWKESQLVFDSQPTRYLMGRVANNIELKDMFIAGEGSFTITCADPIKYDLVETSKASTSNVVTVNYTSLEKATTKFEITLSSDCTNIIITHKETKEVTSLLGSFKTGQKIIIDSDKKSVKLNDVVSMKLVNLENDWLYLEEGTNTFTLTTSVGTAPQFTLKYRNSN